MERLLTIVRSSLFDRDSRGQDARPHPSGGRPAPAIALIVPPAAKHSVPEATPPAEISPNFRPQFGLFVH
jgi:hypothetical protein